ncbi:hypothetical protein [Facklamia miroungae]|uniref:Uncharacterized protein n=1 Tax=Facklamia miroungae TaxID=120956 RepID=A0A1G7PB33_9LACT|nr:hypothetical protein [Facklamia miroungae]NKZ28622.1 hypothetical protein [Facklamia miroungae]SDF82680.1 hypothetical protein SAMN05421791_101163 [Facklamia miroungae]
MEKDTFIKEFRGILKSMQINQHSISFEERNNIKIITIKDNFNILLLMLLNMLGKHGTKFKMMYCCSSNENIDEIIFYIDTLEYEKFKEYFKEY